MIVVVEVVDPALMLQYVYATTSAVLAVQSTPQIHDISVSFGTKLHIPIAFLNFGLQPVYTYRVSQVDVIVVVDVVKLGLMLQYAFATTSAVLVGQSTPRIRNILVSFGTKRTYTYGILFKWTPNCRYL